VPEKLCVTWRVTPLRPPLVRRHCSRCSTDMPFACSLKFRTNAQKKRLDVWLIYRCSNCEDTWNLPLFERAAAGDIEAFDAIARNDPLLALRYAFDRARLMRHGAVEDAPDVSIFKERHAGCPRTASTIAIALALARPCGVRLDRLLALGLGLSRGEIGRLHETGALPPARRSLRSSIADGQTIAIDLAALDARLAESLRRGALA
jgi:hypothetical protein